VWLLQIFTVADKAMFYLKNTKHDTLALKVASDTAMSKQEEGERLRKVLCSPTSRVHFARFFYATTLVVIHSDDVCW
jgi:hypothetical protein